MIEKLPILGICGWSGSGKTTLIESVLPQLVDRNLSVAIVKHDAHKLDVDRPGKDSDRFFKAGANVYMHGNEHFHRLHVGPTKNLEMELFNLSSHYDLIIVEGYKHTPLPKIWLQDSQGSPTPPEVNNILATFAWDNTRTAKLLQFLDTFLQSRGNDFPLYGCILIGGTSRRMGQPKHLIKKGEKSWLEHSVDLLSPFVQKIILVGKAEVPLSLSRLPHLIDIETTSGPLAGILSSMRWQPFANWLVSACDLPNVNESALAWLINQQKPGTWATIPKLSDEKIEPLLALYSYHMKEHLELMNYNNIQRIREIIHHSKVQTPIPPEELHGAWNNINTQEQLKSNE